jgi:hypothetical protein
VPARRSYFPIMTSDDLITAHALSPTFRSRSSTASLVMDEIIVSPGTWNQLNLDVCRRGTFGHGNDAAWEDIASAEFDGSASLDAKRWPVLLRAPSLAIVRGYFAQASPHRVSVVWSR